MAPFACPLSHYCLHGVTGGGVWGCSSDPCLRPLLQKLDCTILLLTWMDRRSGRLPSALADRNAQRCTSCSLPFAPTACTHCLIRPQAEPLLTASCPLQQPSHKATASVLASLHCATKCSRCCLPPAAAHEKAVCRHGLFAFQLQQRLDGKTTASVLASLFMVAPRLLQQLDEETTASVLASLQYATECAPNWAKAWHHFALYNVECMQHYASIDVHTAQRHVAPAVMGFFRSIALSQALGELQMLLEQCDTCCEADASDAFTPPARRMGAALVLSLLHGAGCDGILSIALCQALGALVSVSCPCSRLGPQHDQCVWQQNALPQCKVVFCRVLTHSF